MPTVSIPPFHRASPPPLEDGPRAAGFPARIRSGGVRVRTDLELGAAQGHFRTMQSTVAQPSFPDARLEESPVADCIAFLDRELATCGPAETMDGARPPNGFPRSFSVVAIAGIDRSSARPWSAALCPSAACGTVKQQRKLLGIGAGKGASLPTKSPALFRGGASRGV